MDNYVHINPGSEMCLNGHPVTHKRMDGKPWNCAEPTCKYSLQEDDSTPEALPNNNGQGVSEAPLPSVEANTESLAQLPAEVRPYVEKWINQGRPDEQIHGVLNFFTGAGVEAIQAAKVRVLKQVQGHAHVHLGCNACKVHRELIDTELSKLRSK